MTAVAPVALAGRRAWSGLAVLVLPILLVSIDLTVLHLAVPIPGPAPAAEPIVVVANVLRSAWAPGHCGSTGTRSIDSINGRMEMSLSDYEVRASIAVSDMAQATGFYEGKLGLSGVEDPHDHSRVYACGGGSSFHVYASPTNAGKAPATLATWHVADLEQVVDELCASGVTFVQYHDDQLQTDARGIHTLAAGKVAWFKDPDGNTFAIEQ